MKPPTIAELKTVLNSQRFLISQSKPEDELARRQGRLICIALERWINDRELFAAKRTKKPKPEAAKFVKPVLGYSSDCKCDQCERYRKDLGWINEQR